MLEKYKHNPILQPDQKIFWQERGIFNPAACFYKKKFYIFPRVVDKHYISRIARYVSKDGINFKLSSPKPIFSPRNTYDKFGVEDPRVVYFEKKFWFTYVALRRPAYDYQGQCAGALVITKDLKRFQRKGLITSMFAEDKDIALFPQKINNKYVMIHRPSRWTKTWLLNKSPDYHKVFKDLPLKYKNNLNNLPERPSIWIAYSYDLTNWYQDEVLFEGTEKWENEKIGIGPPPIKTTEGWLLIYHGVSKFGYVAGAALLDLNNPSKVIAKTKEPILVPDKQYEQEFRLPVVFPEGIISLRDDIFVYYGASDKYVALATGSLKKLLNYLKKNKNNKIE